MTYSFCFSPVGVDDFSQQLNKLRWSNKSHLHWVYGGLAVSRGTLFYAASRLAMCFTWNVGRGGWVVGGWFLRTVFLPLLPRSWCFTWNRRIVGSSFWLLEECGSTSLLAIMRSLFRSWENLSTLTSGKSERTNHLACFSLLTETSHVWGRWISFCVTAF